MIQIGLRGGGRMRISDTGVIDVSEVTPEVLAFGLSHVTRFGGQAGPYTDAEHTVRMFDWAKRDGQDKAVLRAILLHDAPECLGEGDTQRFVKRFYKADGLRQFAHDVSWALWNKFCPADRPASAWTWENMHTVLKPYDEWIGALEARAFGFPYDPIPDWLPTEATPDPRSLLPPPNAQYEFLLRWSMCG